MANKAFDKDEPGVDPAATLSLTDLVAALRAATGNDDATMQRKAQFEAEAYRRLEKHENEVHPHISVYSNPLGDIADPKPALKCKMAWVGYELDVSTLTAAEVDLLNRSEPGEYAFTKTDGTRETLTITPQRGPAGNLTRLDFYFPCRGDNRMNLPGMVALLRETQGQGSREAELLAEIARLRADAVAS